MNADPVVSRALLDFARAAPRVSAPWALVGGQALISYGVPREALDADALVTLDGLERLAGELVQTFGWTPLVYDEGSGDFVAANEVTIHYQDDPVLFDVGQERQMIPLRSPLGLPVELLAAQHPVEQEMIDSACARSHQGLSVPVAPLGGILLMMAMADPPARDVGAIEQAGEHLSAKVVREAVAWAEQRDPRTAKKLRRILSAARTRRAPKRTKPASRKR